VSLIFNFKNIIFSCRAAFAGLIFRNYFPAAATFNFNCSCCRVRCSQCCCSNSSCRRSNSSFNGITGVNSVACGLYIGIFPGFYVCIPTFPLKCNGQRTTGGFVDCVLITAYVLNICVAVVVCLVFYFIQSPVYSTVLFSYFSLTIICNPDF
jgi:hypothetical protein